MSTSNATVCDWSFPVSSACGNKQQCPRCASEAQIDQGYEDLEMYESHALYIMDALEQFKANPDYQSLKQELVTSTFRWILIVTRAMQHEKDLSHYGAVLLPALMVEEVCKNNMLGWYFVQRRWRDIEDLSVPKEPMTIA